MRTPRVVLALMSLLMVAISAPSPERVSSRVAVLELDDTIQPASLRYIERGLRTAAAERAALVVIELDTPGGLLDSLRAMTSAILASEVPVAVYVTPAGARAASAGFFLLLAADVAAMAPSTNAGAAHPVTLGGHGRDRDGDDNTKQPARDASLDKAVADAAALARSLAQSRGRPVELAEQAVVESSSFTAAEALDQNLIDIVAANRAQLLAQLDGREVVRVDGRRTTLKLAGADVVVVKHTISERVLTVVADPQIAYLLLMFGALGIVFELMSPGLVVPGIAGGISLLLGMYGLSVLPVRVSGAVLMLGGLALMIAEVFVTSYGMLAVAGLASFVIGSLILVDAPIPELEIGAAVVVPVAIVLAAAIAVLAVRAMRSHRFPAHSGTEAMVGERGRVVTALEQGRDGRVFVHGEYWTATSTRPVPEGAPVRVEAVEGLRLRVSPDSEAVPSGGQT